MASIVSKLARAAVAGGSRPPISPGPCLRRHCQLTGDALRRMCGGVSPAAAAPAPAPEPEEEEKCMGPDSEDTDCLDVADENCLKSKESLWPVYEYWCEYHDLSRSPAEMRRRFKTFSKTARRVHEFNKSGASYKLRLNQFADMTFAETMRRFNS
ncbi:KDEL-tailed cysteine endopeptidase CEP1-like [Aegilops tauschii subsp. strangulata]|uniref:KDEL-tailed cysteine endopeptidase CEP1-like n=1 Tax=Aegilops tauschii subsp. strangulata TaxID=200361 RepID=UPI003CC84FB2